MNLTQPDNLTLTQKNETKIFSEHHFLTKCAQSVSQLVKTDKTQDNQDKGSQSVRHELIVGIGDQTSNSSHSRIIETKCIQQQCHVLSLQQPSTTERIRIRLPKQRHPSEHSSANSTSAMPRVSYLRSSAPSHAA